MPINNYLHVSLPLFFHCKVFLANDRGENVSADFRDLIISDFVALERKAFEVQLDPKLVPQLKYVMAAFIDEMVMNSAWPHRLVWMGRSLQLQFFGEHLAGEEFFERLSQIRQGGYTQIDLLEVCYWCLQLGFQGKYRLHGEEHLLALKVGLHSQIETARGHIDQRLAVFGLPEEGVVKKISREVPFWVIGVITIAIIFFVYFIYSIAIDAQAKTALQQIQHSLSLTEDK